MELINRSGIVKRFISGQGNECASCGLPRREAGKLMRIPGLAGQFCSVLCAEQAIYERGCHWCGEKLESGRFCSTACQRKTSGTKFGDGTRLRDWLRRHGGHTDITIPAVAGEVCLYCGSLMNGKRAGALFCSPRCKMAFRRLPENSEKGHLSVTAG